MGFFFLLLDSLAICLASGIRLMSSEGTNFDRLSAKTALNIEPSALLIVHARVFGRLVQIRRKAKAGRKASKLAVAAWGMSSRGESHGGECLLDRWVSPNEL